jgi:hypothetical protein
MNIRGKAFAVGSAAAVLLTSLSFIGASASVKHSKEITTKPVTLTMWCWCEQEDHG